MKTSTLTANAIIFDYGKKKVAFETITHFRSAFGNYTKVFLKGKKHFLTAFTLKHYSDKLNDNTSFVIARKGVMVNKNHVKAVLNLHQDIYLVLNSGEKFKVSRRRKEEVLRFFA
jgi:DNA-binding LytR/AlgR family response regulator